MKRKVYNVMMGLVVAMAFGLAGCGGGGGSSGTPTAITPATTHATTTDSTTGMVLLKVTGGTYTMGDTFGLEGEKPAHQVTVGDFYIGKYEVSQGEWQAVMGNNPAYFSACGINCPVEQVSWNDVQTYITTLNQRSGKNYRLPTEAEWEYAARSGGQILSHDFNDYSGGNDVNAVAWYIGNSGSTTHPKGLKQPNSLGLYDMSGNVYEWVSDLYGSYISSTQTNPTGSISGTSHVVRGGSWADIAVYERAAHRHLQSPGLRRNFLGFRLAESSVVNSTSTVGEVSAPRPTIAPSGVVANGGNGQTTISWDSVIGATYYNIYWSTSSTVSKTTGTKITNVTTNPFTHTGLVNGTTYFYVVTAVKSSGESVASSVVSVTLATPPSPSPTTRFIDKGNGTIYDTISKLTWLKNANCVGARDWNNAHSFAFGLASGQCGLTDGSVVGQWHMPTYDEYWTLIGDGYRSNTLNTSGFKNVQSNSYWSSSGPGINNYAYDVHMGTGLTSEWGVTMYASLSVWAVR